MNKPPFATETILGFSIAQGDPEACCQEVISWLDQTDHSRYFVCANPHSLITAQSDPLFRQAILAADLKVADGAGIVLASRILGGKIRHRLTGSDLFAKINQAVTARGGGRCFFLGSTPETLEKIHLNMASVYPLVRIVGSYSPPFVPIFSPEETSLMVDTINRAKPDLLWVGMTAPKQEKWIHENIHRLHVPVIGPIGAVFDFFTGKIKRSSPLFQSLGLEWLPRLLQDPKHLWKRNFISTPKFLAAVLMQKWSERPWVQKNRRRRIS